MEECRGVFSMCKHPYIEVDSSRCDGYRRFAENAARKCKVPYEENCVYLNSMELESWMSLSM